MKFQYNILERVRRIEEKNGVYYAKIDGKLYSTLKVTYFLLFIYTLVINLLSVLGLFVAPHVVERNDEINKLIVTIIVASVFLIIAMLFIKLREHLWANITSAVLNLFSCVALIFAFAHQFRDALGFLGYNLNFYWRHGIPLALIAIISVWLFVIALRSILFTQKEYKKVLDTLYEQYLASVKDGQTTEEGWQEYLKNCKF